MSELRDFTGKNRKFTGSVGERISTGSTGDRVNTQGVIRFNTTTNLMEYYSGTDWKAIDAPPVITSFALDGASNVTSAVIDNEGGGTVSVAVNGSLFDTTGANVTFIGSGETLSPNTITRNNANLLTAVFTESAFDVGNSPYTLKVTNGSGLSAELAECISADQTIPVFTNAADTTITLGDIARDAGISAAALCGASGATSFAVTTGSLPAGLSMTSGTGAITGTANAVGTNTTSTFTVTATGDDATATRQFKITINAPVIASYTSSSGTFSVPSGITTVDVLVLAGGGGGGSGTAGGGGAGGYIERPGFPVSPGGNVSYNVGGGNPRPGATDIGPGGRGSDSVFGSLTAKGGGGGASSSPGSYSGPSTNGGSGGGGSAYPIFNTGGSPGIQPGQPGDSGNYGFGTAGITGPAGGGGGGAGGTGSARIGGPGKTSNISGSSVTRGGGGRGQADSPNPGGGAPGGGGGNSGSYGSNAPANQGGGGGAGWDYGGGRGGSGGSGIVIVKY